MHDHTDGFRLAEIDLELRGEGEMLGVRQSGMQAFKFARLPEDVELLERARRHAREILDHDPNLRKGEHALLEDAIVRAYGPDAFEPIPA
jgi:ATP-dependent DNA helicase RecG